MASTATGSYKLMTPSIAKALDIISSSEDEGCDFEDGYGLESLFIEAEGSSDNQRNPDNESRMATSVSSKPLENALYVKNEFGERYKAATEMLENTATNQRVPLISSNDNIKCLICIEEKNSVQFPQYTLTASCEHAPTTCNDCVRESIRADLRNRSWNDIRCPECTETLQYVDMQQYADEESFSRLVYVLFSYSLFP